MSTHDALGSARSRCAARPRRRRRRWVGCDVDRQRADLQAAGVEQVADEPVEPIGLLVDGDQRLGELVRRSTSTVGSRRPDTIALIDASGVRRSCDTARSSAVRTASTSASAAASAASAASAWLSIASDELVGERRAGAVGRRPTVSAPNSSSVGRPVRRPTVESASDSRRRRRSQPTSPADAIVGAVDRRREADAGRGRTSMRICSTSRWQRVGVGGEAGRRAGECLGLEPGAARFERAPRRDVDERADRDGDGDEHDEGDEVLGVGDRERVVRRDEEPVDEQRGDDRGDRCRRAGRRSRRSRARATRASSSSVDRSIVVAERNGRPR